MSKTVFRFIRMQALLYCASMRYKYHFDSSYLVFSVYVMQRYKKIFVKTKNNQKICHDSYFLLLTFLLFAIFYSIQRKKWK